MRGRLLTGVGWVAVVAGFAAAARGRHATRVAAERALGRLADQQIALRRVATLVAGGVPAAEVFAAVAEEAGRVMNAEIVNIARYEPDGTVTVMAGWSERGGHMPVGGRFTLEGPTLAGPISRTGRPARIENYQAAVGSIASFLEELGIRSGVGSPIVVNGRLWGLVSVLSPGPDPPPPDTARRRGRRAHWLGGAAGAAAPDPRGPGRRAGRPAGGLARHPPGDPVAGRPGLGAAGARPALRPPGRARPAPGGGPAGAGRGRGLLRGGRGARQRRQARQRLGRAAGRRGLGRRHPALDPRRWRGWGRSVQGHRAHRASRPRRGPGRHAGHGEPRGRGDIGARPPPAGPSVTR